ncbi:hypothetical protein Tco_0231833 [Tanacetum coccineum]
MGYWADLLSDLKGSNKPRMKEVTYVSSGRRCQVSNVSRYRMYNHESKGLEFVTVEIIEKEESVLTNYRSDYKGLMYMFRKKVLMSSRVVRGYEKLKMMIYKSKSLRAKPGVNDLERLKFVVDIQRQVFEKVILLGADNRPPMLEKDMYDSWKSIMELYMMNRQHGQMILESVENGPLIWPTIEENGVTRPRKYSELTLAYAI